MHKKLEQKRALLFFHGKKGLVKPATYAKLALAA
jgi:hypothetical protein